MIGLFVLLTRLRDRGLVVATPTHLDVEEGEEGQHEEDNRNEYHGSPQGGHLGGHRTGTILTVITINSQ